MLDIFASARTVSITNSALHHFSLLELDNEDDIGFIPLDEAILAADSNANVPAEEYFKLSSHYNKLSISKVQAEHRARLAEAELVRQADLHKSMEENLLNRFTVRYGSTCLSQPFTVNVFSFS